MKLAVFFPGIGYTVDKPLMHYSRRIAEKLGYEIRLLPYTGFPEKRPGDTAYMEQAFELAYAQSLEMLSGLDLAAYEDILFVGKSIGTAVAARIAAESPEKDRIRLLLYTPLQATFAYPVGQALAFTGTKDQWTSPVTPGIAEICEEKRIPCVEIPDANHSLECGDVIRDIENLRGIMEKTQEFIK